MTTSTMDGKTRHGSDPGREGKRTYKDAASAQKAYDKLVATKRAAGYRRVDRPDDVEAVPTEVHRNADLEAAILSADDPAPFLVYADWLQERGDPRGEFIALQHTMRQQADPKRFLEFKQREQALRFAHERAWLGETVVACAHRLKLDWKYGFVESARIEASMYPTEPTLADVLDGLLRSPAGFAVRALDFTAPVDGRPDQLLAAAALLPTPSLRRLTGASRAPDTEAAALAATDAFEPHRKRITAAGASVNVRFYY